MDNGGALTQKAASSSGQIFNEGNIVDGSFKLDLFDASERAFLGVWSNGVKAASLTNPKNSSLVRWNENS